MTPLQLTIDGVSVKAVEVTEDLPRAVLISLFTWRRANADDPLPDTSRFGWWGDTYPEQVNDRIGSRIWLLSRGKVTSDTISRAREYAEEALAWLVDDGAAAAVSVVSERYGLDGIALGITITRGDRSKLNIRFTNVWDYINAI